MQNSKNLTLPVEGFARPAQVAFAFGISRGTLYKRIKDGKFPPPEKIGGRISRWPVSVIREHLVREGGSVLVPGCQDSQPTPAS